MCSLPEGSEGETAYENNALNGTDYHDEQALQIVTLDSVVYMSMYNDVAFILAGTLGLYEHQSTICPNLPLRFLLYIAAEFESLLARMDANIYGGTLIRLPAPQCIVFYNGEAAVMDEQIMRLSNRRAIPRIRPWTKRRCSALSMM